MGLSNNRLARLGVDGVRDILLSAKQAIEELQEATGITGATNTAWCVRIFVDLQDSKAILNYP